MKRKPTNRHRRLQYERLESRRVLTTLLSGQEVLGVVGGGDNDIFEVTVEQSREVRVYAGKVDPYGTDGGLYMRLLNPAGEVLGWDEGYGTREYITPDYSGVLTIQVCLADAYAAKCNSTADLTVQYRLRVFNSAQEHQQFEDRDVSLASGEEADLSTPFSSFAIVTFFAEEGQNLRMHAGSDVDWNSPPFPDLRIWLFDPAGNRMRPGADSYFSREGTNKARAGANAPLTGNYVALVSEGLISADLTFRFRIFVTGSELELLQPRDAHLNNGQMHESFLPFGGLNIFTFDAIRDANVRFSIGDITDGGTSTRPRFEVFGPSGNRVELDRVYGASRFPVIEFIAPETGVFSILIHEYNGVLYAQSLSFKVRLFLSVPSSTIQLGAQELRISSGEELKSETMAGLPAFVFMDLRQSGGVRIAVGNEDSGENAPRLELFGPDGELVSEVEPQGSVSSVIELSTTTIGTHILLVYDYRNDDDLHFRVRMFNGGGDQALIAARDHRLLPGLSVDSSVDHGMFNIHEFLALPDDEVSLSIERLDGSEDDPFFAVFSPTGIAVPVSRNGSNWTFTSVQFGTYTVLVFAEHLRSDDTVNYSIELNGTLGDTVYDFGDAPQPFPVSGDRGALHVVYGPKLGVFRDSETESDNHPSALGDDTQDVDDEDGIVFQTHTVGQHDATLQLTASEGARVDAWIDFNGDGNWGGRGEQILDAALVVAGTNVIKFEVPEWAKSGYTYARFRISSAGDLGQLGQAADGEVEDYRLEIMPPIASNALFEPGRLIDSFEAADAALESADLDCDGDSDLIYADDGIFWVENQISGFSDRRLVADFADSGNVWQLSAEDLDGDGDKDIVSTSWEENRLVWYENRGSEGFVSHSIAIDQDGVIGVAVADMEGDGDYDLVVGSWRDGKITVFANDGAGGFTASRVMSQPGGSVSVQVYDVDYDGDLDIVSGSQNGDRIDWFENEGMAFTRRSVTDAVDSTQRIWVADINGDGHADVLSANFLLNGGSITLHRNDGDENFTQVMVSDSTMGARHVTVGDMDGDGDLDLIASYGDEFAWLRQASNGDFSKIVLDDDARFAREAIPVDIDLDGDLDIVGISAGDNDLRWYRNVNSFNDPPTGITLLPSAVEENSSIGNIVGELTASDPNPGDTITFSLVSGEGDEDNGLFRIEGSQLRVNASLDHEESETRSIRLRATDQDGLWTEASFVVQVVDINESPNDIAISNASIAENLIPDTFIGTFSTEDQDENDFFAYQLVDGEGSNNNNLFTIVGDDLRSNAVFDFETQSRYSIRVRSTDSGSESEERFFTILIVNRNDSPTGIELSNASIDENLPPGTEIGMLTAIDQDADDEFEFQLPDGEGDNDAFQIIDNSLQTNQAFDFEQRSQYRAVVTVRDREGARETVTLEITVLDVNEPSNSISLSSNLIPENAASATLVGQLSTDDPDQDDQFAYELVSVDGSDDNAAFSIEGSELRTAVEFDFETRAAHAIRVRSTDSAGNVLEQIFSVMVTDQNDAPTGLELSQSSVDENVPIGSEVGILSALDEDANDQFLFELVGDDADNLAFEIQGNMVRTASTLNFERQSRYEVRVSVTDEGNRSVTETLVLEVNDVNETPTDIALSQMFVPENESIGSFVGELSATDPDPEDDLTFELIDGSGAQDNDRFSISGSALLTNESFDYETQAIYSIRISANDSGGLSIEKIFQIEIQDVDDSVPEDVNGDGIVRPLDALIVINYLNRSISPTVTDETRSLDVNRNGLITPIDALIIINYLNRQPRGEGEAPQQSSLHESPLNAMHTLNIEIWQYGLISACLDDSDDEFDL